MLKQKPQEQGDNADRNEQKAAEFRQAPIAEEQTSNENEKQKRRTSLNSRLKNGSHDFKDDLKWQSKNFFQGITSESKGERKFRGKVFSGGEPCRRI